jgi:hypothetical protein
MLKGVKKQSNNTLYIAWIKRLFKQYKHTTYIIVS